MKSDPKKVSSEFKWRYTLLQTICYCFFWILLKHIILRILSSGCLCKIHQSMAISNEVLWDFSRKSILLKFSENSFENNKPENYTEIALRKLKGLLSDELDMRRWIWDCFKLQHKALFDNGSRVCASKIYCHNELHLRCTSSSLASTTLRWYPLKFPASSTNSDSLKKLLKLINHDKSNLR